LTGIIIGEQVPFTETLREFNVQSVFVFLRAVERYEHQYPRTVALVRHVDAAILDAITTNPEHGDDLPRKVKTWTPQQLKTAMRRYFQTFQLHAEDLCEVANACIRFPKTGMVRDTASPAQRAIAQLAQLPVYCASLARFNHFVTEYQLLSAGWPKERNPTRRKAHRLNEVLQDILKDNAKYAWSVLEIDFYEYRKCTFRQLVDNLRDLCVAKISELNQAAQTYDRLLSIPNTAVATAGQYARTGSSTAAKTASHGNFGKPSVYYSPKKLNHMEQQGDDTEDPEEPTWNDAPSTYPEEVLDDPEELNAIQGVADGKSYDRSKEACHSYLFNPNGCSYLAKGKPCPFSHDPKIGMVAVEAARNNLLKLQK
jgi:hypothetical protein